MLGIWKIPHDFFRSIKVTNTKKGQEMYAKALRLIPGGTQLLSKRPEMFLPGSWPNYYTHAKGAEIIDLDGNTYLDMSYCGVGATVLGYADDDVDMAVKTAIDSGSMSTLNCPEEVELAELLVQLHPWAGSARFARAGGEALAVAVRIARAHTGRQVIAFCGYHGWHDWYLSANLAEDDALDGHLLPGLSPSGVPRNLAGLTQPFHYNDFAAIKSIADRYGTNLAAIVMEPVRGTMPVDGFLENVRKLADDTGAALIFDEVTVGWRINTGGIHLTLGVNPDIAVFAKAMGNGYPISAVLGRADVMSAAENTFISSTAWTERVGPAAALATIGKFTDKNVSSHLMRLGELVKLAWEQASKSSGLGVKVAGLAPLAHFKFCCEDAQAVRTLFTQMMLDRGYLARESFYAMYAHTEAQIDAYTDACCEVFKELANAVDSGTVKNKLRGPVAHTGFQRLT